MPAAANQTALAIPPLTAWYIPAEGSQATIGFDHPDGSGHVTVLDVSGAGGYAAAGIAKQLLDALRFAGWLSGRQPEIERLLNQHRPLGPLTKPVFDLPDLGQIKL